MKHLIIILVLCFNSMAWANSSCSEDAAKGSECEIVKTYTRCDLEKQALRRKIAVLEQRIKELESERIAILNKQTVIINSERVIKETETEYENKHHILSVYMVRDIHGTQVDNSTGTADVQTAYEPGIKYQYQFNFGLVPEIGINIKGHPMFGLGFEF